MKNLKDKLLENLDDKDKKILSDWCDNYNKI
jgi:hypothetical protein